MAFVNVATVTGDVFLPELDVTLTHPSTTDLLAAGYLITDIYDSSTLLDQLDSGGLTLEASGSIVASALNPNDISSVALYTTTSTINAGATGVFSGVPLSSTVNVVVDVPNQGSEIVRAGTIDADNVSTFDANLINDNETDLVYQNSSSGHPKNLPGIDLGSSQSVETIRVYWWTNATYMSLNYSIQSSDNGTTWTDRATGLSSVGFEGQFQDISVNATARYWRVRSITGNNVSFTVISEMRAYAPGVGFTSQSAYGLDTVQISSNGSGDLQVINNGTQNLDFIIGYVQ